MLAFIQIRNFAIIDQAELELDAGLTVLSGETGAGKSILVDALGLVLGDRADASALRHGAERGEISASFQLPEDAPALKWLRQQDLDDDGECLVRRTLSRSGRSRAFINARTVPLASLRELGEFLADIHGQHEHQSLVRPAVQRQILDHLGGNSETATQVVERYRHWASLESEIDQLQTKETERSSRLELLRYQAKELASLAPQPEELSQLEDEHRKLAGAGQLAEGTERALAALDNDQEGSACAAELLSQAERLLAELAEIDPALSEAAALLQEASISLREGADTLSRYLDGLEMDPGRLTWVETRMAAMYDVARKHKVEAAELPRLADQLASELASLEGADAKLDALQAELAGAEQEYLAAAARLSKARKKAAQAMSADVSNLMQALGMQGGRFEVAVSSPDDAPYTEQGRDRIEFLVSANPGQPPGQLGKVASGGELSRISLAVQVIAADATPTGCLVFDEVDAGVGGGVAEIVGRRLRELGASRQVLCVTHLPQVASQAHHHVRVSKLTDGKTTRTVLRPLAPDESIEELARMLGGVEITDKTREHAREMIARSGES